MVQAENSTAQGPGARQLLRALRALADARAPATLLPGVLARTGLGDAFAPIETPIGPFYVAYNELGISMLARAGDDAAFARRFRERTGRAAHRVPALPPELARSIAGVLAGEARPGRLRFDLRGLSEFERAVLERTLTIPRGEVRPYAWIAREIGRPGAVRAVGSALGRNPVPLLIPCHRVVRSDGRVGNYALGPADKRVILAAEGVDPDRLEGQAARGVRFVGSDTTRIYCFPTCRCARRITERHRVTFASRAAAEAAGYRACAVCRPVA